ncbi:related to ethionine resistance protein [Serendipita indica DSM 11827]|uniref:Related to ethionine resistance protein n=1 Tax=Serendipita indica (strain DSM 11827) TaxID=1109443 RepID=G4TGT7_SERID|nr:related to ethionine resistance protein [Serendipita indica DSM 11827]
MPFSSSWSTDRALVQRYAASRGQVDATPELEDAWHSPTSPSSPFPGGEDRPLLASRISPAVNHVSSAGKWAQDSDNDHSRPTPTINVTESTPLIPHEPSGGSARPGDRQEWWSEVRTLCAFTLPVLGTHICEYSLSIAPVISTGHISTEALAAVTLGTMTASVTGFSIIIGFSTALDTMLPSAWTSGTPSLVGLWTLRMFVLMTAILIPIAMLWLNAEVILLALRQEPEIAKLAGIYLRWFMLGLPAYAFNAIVRRFFQSQGLFSAPTRIVVIVAPINILLNWLLVWGPDWIRLGFIGAPIATAISLNLTSCLYTFYGLWFTSKVAWHPVNKECLHDLRRLFRLGFAGVAQIAAEWWSWELCGLVASQIGSLELAVQSVLLVSASTSYQAPYALSSATSVRVGNMLGARNARGAALATRVSIFLSFIVALLMSAVFLLFRKNWAYMFNDDPYVVKEVAHILPLVALFQIFDGLGAITGAILRALGKQDIGAMLSLVGYYAFGIPLGIVLAFKAGLGLEGLWVGLTLALVFVGVTGLYICTIRTNWETEVHKAMVRLGHEQEEPPRNATTTSNVVP